MAENAFFSKWSEIYTQGGTRDNSEEKSIFVEVGGRPQTQRQFHLHAHFQFIRDVLDKARPKDVLEVGCGRGTMGLYIKTRLNIPVTLLDNVPSAIDLAKEEFKKRSASADFYTASALSAPLPDESFDAIVSIGLAEHFETVDELFVEQYRLLRSGGVMISYNIPKKKFSVLSLNIVMRIFKKLLGLYRAPVKKDYFRNSLKPKEYREVLKRAGFIDVSTVHACPYPLFVPVSWTTDRILTYLYRWMYSVRKLFGNPHKTNAVISPAHFLIGFKK